MKKNFIFIIIGLIIVVVLTFYFSIFNGRISNNNADWGNFGGYITGTAGVCFSLLTLLLFIKTFNIQRRMLFENTFQQLVVSRNYKC